MEEYRVPPSPPTPPPPVQLGPIIGFSTAGGIFAICCAYCVVKEMKSYLAQKEYKRKMRMLARPPTSSTKVMPEVLVPEGKDKEDAAYENVVLVPSV